MNRATQAVILVVEDDSLGRELAKEVLATAGYTVLTAGDGVGLLERVRGERPDLILLDIQLPQIDGVTLLRQLKTHDETRSIPVVMTTAYALIEPYVAAMDGGCAAYLTKPLNAKLLLQTVADLLKR